MIEKVLLVEDDNITITLCELAIKKFDFAKEVHSSRNGKEALDYFSDCLKRKKKGEESEAPPLIFLDLNMPVLNGWDFLDEYLKKFAKDFPKTRVAILSSTIDPNDFSRASKYDIVVEFISKPLTMRVLKELKKNSSISQYFPE